MNASTKDLSDPVRTGPVEQTGFDESQEKKPVMADAPVNILLVDDDGRNLDVLESVLESPAYNLVRALSADRALMQLIQGDFAVIVMDIQMPQMSGIELAHLIKQRKRTQHIPIIFLTAYYQEDNHVLAGYGTGAVDYLIKPLNPQILKSKISVFADLYRKTRALAAANRSLELEVAQRQQAEEALRCANNELESRVEARTVELLNINNELREREKTLIEREAQLRLVTDHAPVFIVQLDRAHQFKFVNRTYASCFKAEPEQMIGKHFSEILGQEPYETIRPHVDAALGGQSVEFEVEIPFASSGVRWLHVVHEPERTPQGEIVGIVAVINDITERKSTENEIVRARDRAMAASRAKDEFLARLSHELRTPLNPVLLVASEAAQNPALPSQIRADFEVIAQNVALEARLIDDLLDLTSILHGKVALTCRPLDVHTILEDSLKMVRADIIRKNLSITLDLKAARRTVFCDEVRMKQVFWNILKNAVKFTPEGGAVKVATLIDEEGANLSIQIADSGIGMTEDEIKRVFVAFSQGDHAGGGTSHRFGGLGLGLAISRLLVDLHSGTIRATSAGRNGGSTFHIQFPLHNETQRSEDPPTRPASSSQAVTTTHSSAGAPMRRILLVEDHKPTRNTLALLLQRRHYDVVTADCFAAARAVAEREVFDLLISDIGLPDGNGCDLMSELRDRCGLRGIAITGYGMEEDVRKGRLAGFCAHLTKPVSVEALDQALQSLAAPR
ncbi:MAG: response regulator [Nibricoccus sp.]